MSAVLRMKASVQSIKRVADSEDKVSQEEVRLQAVYSSSEENKQWCKWTPHINFDFTISNPDAFGKLRVGQSVFIDITPEHK